MTISKANWSYPTKVWFGPGRIADLPAACRETGMKRPLLVTDPGLSALPMIAATARLLRDAGIAVEVFDKVQGNPTSVNLDDALAAYRAGDHDGVIAFGGGSALDVGKTTAFMAGQTRPVWDFEDIDDNWRRASGDIAPIIAVATTSGTGSEVGRATVITNAETHVKKIIFHPAMMPAIAIADPELTVGLPPSLTAATGMDALSHALEAYCAPGYHPMADAIAIEGVRLVRDWLARAVRDGTDIEARGHMMSAAAMGATAFQKGLGAIHSLSHPIGALYDTHHGMTNAVFMPYVLAFNRDAVEDKIGRLSAYCGIKGGFDGFAKAILKLRKELKVPHTLPGLIKGLEMDKKRAGLIADMAVVDPTAGGNPVKLTKKAALALLENALEGTL